MCTGLGMRMAQKIVAGNVEKKSVLLSLFHVFSAGTFFGCIRQPHLTGTKFTRQFIPAKFYHEDARQLRAFQLLSAAPQARVYPPSATHATRSNTSLLASRTTSVSSAEHYSTSTQLHLPPPAALQTLRYILCGPRSIRLV